jgi:hypothetical protein
MSGHGNHGHSDNPEHKRVGIIISVIAVAMAIVGALAKQQSNDLIVKEVKASNGFSWFQSKRQRSYVNDLEINRIDIEMAGSPTDAQKKMLEAQRAKLVSKNAEYDAEGKDILKAANGDREAATTAAHKHHLFEYSEICLHTAIVLCSLVLLTDRKVFFRLGLIATFGGLGIACAAQFSGHSNHTENGAKADAKVAVPEKPAGGGGGR